MLFRDTRASARRRWSAAFCLPLLVCWGCGTGEYERRLEEGLAKSKTESKFNGLYAPQPLPDLPISVRLPRIFTDSPLVEGAPGKDGKPVDPRRLKPRVFNLPGLKFTYETLVEDPKGVKVSCYCYVAAFAMAGSPIRDLGGVLLGELNNKPQFEKLTAWSDFQGETPEGRGNPWKKLSFVSQQDFLTVDKNGKQRYAQMPGLLEICLHEEAGHYVAIVWRIPSSVEQKFDLAKWIPLVAGSVTVKK